MMAHVEVDRLEKRMSCQCLRRLRILGCRYVKSDTGRLNRFDRVAVNDPIPAGKLNRIYITAR